MEDDRLWTVREVAEHFGVTTQAVYTWVKQGELRHQKIGRIAPRIVVPESAVQELEQRRAGKLGADYTAPLFIRLLAAA